MAFYNKGEQLYLETYASGVHLAASLLQVRDVLWLPKKEALNNVALWPLHLQGKA